MDDWNEKGVLLGVFERKMNSTYGKFIYRYTYLASLAPLPLIILSFSVRRPNWYNDPFFQMTFLLMFIICLLFGVLMNHMLSRMWGGLQIYSKGVQLKKSTFDRITGNKRFYPTSSISGAVYSISDIVDDRKQIVGEHRWMSLRSRNNKKFELPMLQREEYDKISLLLSKDLQLEVTLDDQRRSSRGASGLSQSAGIPETNGRAQPYNVWCTACGNHVPSTDDYCMHCGRSMK